MRDGGGGGGGGGGSRVSDFFLQMYKESKNPNLKKKYFLGWRVGVGRGGVGEGVWAVCVCGRVVAGSTDEQTQTNLPLQLLRSWGHNNV